MLDAFVSKLLRAGINHGCIAGGYVRDVALGGIPRDIDFYYTYDYKFGVVDDLEVGESIGMYGGVYNHPYIEKVTKCTFRGTPVDLIQVNKDTRVGWKYFLNHNFDVGLSMIGYDIDTEKVVLTERFLNDVQFNQLTVYGPREVCKEYVKKVHDKYPLHQIIWTPRNGY